MNIDKIGKFIKELREEKGLTQDELAKKIPISRQAISKWERGLAIPDAQTLLKLSEFFSVSVNEILSGEKKNKYNSLYSNFSFVFRNFIRAISKFKNVRKQF